MGVCFSSRFCECNTLYISSISDLVLNYFKSNRFTILRVLAFFSLITFLFISQRSIADIHVVANEKTKLSDIYKDIENYASRVATKDNILIILGELPLPATDGSLFDYKYIITIGASAAKHNKFNKHSIIYSLSIDPPVETLILLALNIYGDTSRIAVPIKKNFISESEIKALEKKYENVHFIEVKNIRDFFRKARSYSAVVAVPDPRLYNDSNVASIARSMYRQGKGLIGFTYSMAKTGSLAVTYVDSPSLLKSIKKHVEGINSKTINAGLRYPIFRIEVNERLGKTLGVIIPPVNEIEAKINELSEINK